MQAQLINERVPIGYMSPLLSTVITFNSLTLSVESTSVPITSNNTFASGIVFNDRQMERVKVDFFNSLKYSNNFHLKNIQSHSIKSIVNEILQEIYYFNPDTVVVQLASNESIMFSFSKNTYTFYLEHFINNKRIGLDECYLTCFNKEDEIIDYNGSLYNAYNHVEQTIVENKLQSINPNIEINVFDLSFDTTTEKELQIY